MSEYSSLIQEYYTNPINNYRMEDATISYHEWNPLCGDDITVYMKFSVDNELSEDITQSELVAQNAADRLQSTKLTARSYDGNVSMNTQAAASFFSEFVMWKTLQELLAYNEQLMIDEWFEVSHRRRRARVIAILATHNAIHTYLWDGVVEEFEEVLVD